MSTLESRHLDAAIVVDLELGHFQLHPGTKRTGFPRVRHRKKCAAGSTFLPLLPGELNARHRTRGRYTLTVRNPASMPNDASRKEASTVAVLELAEFFRKSAKRELSSRTP
jgi:hypothetical protein